MVKYPSDTSEFVSSLAPLIDEGFDEIESVLDIRDAMDSCPYSGMGHMQEPDAISTL